MLPVLNLTLFVCGCGLASVTCPSSISATMQEIIIPTAFQSDDPRINY